MSKLKKEIDSKIVKSVNKNVRSSTKKLNPILKSSSPRKRNFSLARNYLLLKPLFSQM